MRFLRRWWWAILLGLLVAARALLPGIVRSQIEQRASAALHANVHVGDVDLGLLAGAVALEDVAVRTVDEPADAEPLIAWKRVAVNLRWLMLPWKTIRFSTVEIDEPHVALDRLASGDINLAALVPASEPKPEEEKPAEPSGWKLGVDYFALRQGAVRFRDLVFPEAEPVTARLQSIEVRDISLEPGVYRHPADVRFTVRLDEGTVRTRARITPRKEGGMAVDVTLDASRLPVHRSLVYVPGVAWTDLTGALSMGLRYRLETGGRNEVSGTVALDDVTVWASGLDEPALAWRGLGIELDKIDLAKHDAGVRRVTLDGVVVPVRPSGPDVLPLLGARAAAKAATPAAPPAPDQPPPAPWTWHVAAVRVADGRARLLSAGPPLDVGVTLDAAALSGPTHAGSPVKLGLAIGEGKLGVDGTLQIEPLGFAGKVTSAALDLPSLVDAVGALPPGVLQVAKLDADLQVSLGSAAPTPGDVTVAGTAGVTDLWIAAEDPAAFAAGAKHVGVGIGGVTVPGALAKGGAGGRPLAVALDRVDADALYARITRAEQGIVLPAFGKASETPPAPPPPAPATPPQVTVQTVAVNGRVDVMDRTVQPFYWNALDPLTVAAQGIRVPDLEVGALDVHAVSATKGSIDVKGGFTKKSDLEAVVKDLVLPPFNPYVTAMSPYSIARGSLFVTTKAAIDGPRWDTKTWITLSSFDLSSRSGQQLMLEQLGIPLTVALALLRDWKGNIDLTVPVEFDEKGASVGLGTIVTNALVSALVGTLTSPLKLIGAVVPLGGKGAEGLVPVPVDFRPGLATLDDSGAAHVKQLAAFLAGRPGVGVTLSAPATPADVRALREQALLAQLGPRKGVIGTLRNIGARGRIVDALAARARGEKGELDADDAKTLDEYLEAIPPPSPEELARLGEARLAVVEKTLREQYGIGARQIARAKTPPGAPGEGDPSVRVEIGAAGG